MCRGEPSVVVRLVKARQHGDRPYRLKYSEYDKKEFVRMSFFGKMLNAW
jgi:hypothetical protein